MASRARHRYRTGFRVLARGFGRYDIHGRHVAAAETQEVCASLSHCRALGVKRSTALLRIRCPGVRPLRLVKAVGPLVLGLSVDLSPMAGETAYFRAGLRSA